MRRAGGSGPDFLTFHARPKRAVDVLTWPDRVADAGTIAIVMQGPIAARFDFTLETLRLYGRIPHCRRILSTWEDTPDEHLAPLRAMGVDVVLCKKPPQPGLFNVNMQITSAARGVEAAVQGGAQWVLKTRTDQRLCAPNAVAFLVALATTFPVAPGFDQKHRIVGVGHGSLKYAPYHLSDQSVFGHAHDMAKYWSPVLREEPLPAHWPRTLREIYANVPIGELCRHGAAESYLASRYLQRLGRPLQWTLEDSWQVFKDHFCVADHATTDFFWMKAQLQTWRELLTDYDGVSAARELTFADWLLLQSGLLAPSASRAFESVLGQGFRTTVAAAR